MIAGWISAVALALCARVSQDDEAWKALFGELGRLKAGELAAAEADMIRSHLGEAARSLAGDPRAELVRAELETIAGGDATAAALRLAAIAPDAFTPDARWFLADSLPAGPVRARIVLAALETPRPLNRWELLLAWNAAVDESRALRLRESTLPIQRQLHERYLADWSAMDLTLTLRLLGERRALEALFEETIAREAAAGRPVKELWTQRGIAAAGFGDDRRARDYLGRGLALGSDDAGLVLARMDLAAGNTLASRDGFRASILGEPPADWAWRGWGTTLLPIADRAAAVLRTPSTQHGDQ